jgi:hypothetical protein
MIALPPCVRSGAGGRLRLPCAPETACRPDASTPAHCAVTQPQTWTAFCHQTVFKQAKPG